MLIPWSPHASTQHKMCLSLLILKERGLCSRNQRQQGIRPAKQSRILQASRLTAVSGLPEEDVAACQKARRHHRENAEASATSGGPWGRQRVSERLTWRLGGLPGCRGSSWGDRSRPWFWVPPCFEVPAHWCMCGWCFPRNRSSSDKSSNSPRAPHAHSGPPRLKFPARTRFELPCLRVHQNNNDDNDP
jgi:hypothetical protein